MQQDPQPQTPPLGTGRRVTAIQALQQTLNGGDAAWIGIQTGQRGAEHGSEGRRNDDPGSPGTHGVGVDADEVLGKGDATALHHPVAGAIHRVGTKDHEEYGGDHRDAIAELEVGLGLLERCRVITVAGTGEHPKRWPHAHLHRPRHPAHQRYQKAKVGPLPGRGVGRKPGGGHIAGGTADQQ